MFYSNKVLRASQLAEAAHRYQEDKLGYPYIMHPLYLSFQMDDEDSVCVALLHDALEDAPEIVNEEKLKEIGLSKRVIDAIKLLTHKKGVPYLEYISAIKENDLARKIKIADLKHNLDPARRLEGFKKKELYESALKILEEANE